MKGTILSVLAFSLAFALLCSGAFASVCTVTNPQPYCCPAYCAWGCQSGSSPRAEYCGLVQTGATSSDLGLTNQFQQIHRCSYNVKYTHTGYSCPFNSEYVVPTKCKKYYCYDSGTSCYQRQRSTPLCSGNEYCIRNPGVSCNSNTFLYNRYQDTATDDWSCNTITGFCEKHSQPQAVCGNNVCETGESSSNCCSDCGCPTSTWWSNTGSSYDCCSTDNTQKCTCQPQQEYRKVCQSNVCVTQAITGSTRVTRTNCNACSSSGNRDDNTQTCTYSTCDTNNNCNSQQQMVTDYCEGAIWKKAEGSSCTYTDVDCSTQGTGYVCKGTAPNVQCGTGLDSVSGSHTPSSPVAGETVTITAAAQDSDGISELKLFVDNTQETVLSCSTGFPTASTGQVTCSKNIAYGFVGTHTYHVEAKDNSQNQWPGQTQTYSFSVGPKETSPPGVSLSISPSAPLTTDLVTFIADAWDDDVIKKVTIYLGIPPYPPYNIWRWNPIHTCDWPTYQGQTCTQASPCRCQFQYPNNLPAATIRWRGLVEDVSGNTVYNEGSFTVTSEPPGPPVITIVKVGADTQEPYATYPDVGTTKGEVPVDITVNKDAKCRVSSQDQSYDNMPTAGESATFARSHTLKINYGTAAGVKKLYIACKSRQNEEGKINKDVTYDTSPSVTFNFVRPCDITSQTLQSSCIDDKTSKPRIYVRVIANDPNTGVEDIKYKLCTYEYLEDPQVTPTPCSPTNEIQTGVAANDYWTELDLPSDQWGAPGEDENLDYTFAIDWDGNPNNGIQDPPVGEYLVKVSTMNGAGEWDEAGDPVGVAITSDEASEEPAFLDAVKSFFSRLLSFFGL